MFTRRDLFKRFARVGGAFAVGAALPKQVGAELLVEEIMRPPEVKFSPASLTGGPFIFSASMVLTSSGFDQEINLEDPNG